MADEEFSPFGETLRNIFEHHERENIVQKPLAEAFSYVQAAVALFQTDPRTSAMLLQQAVLKLNLYADRIEDIQSP